MRAVDAFDWPAVAWVPVFESHVGLRELREHWTLTDLAEYLLLRELRAARSE